MLKIDFYYWGEQCPHNSINKKILNSLSNDERFSINYYDISRNFKLAEELKMFSPTLLVFNDEFRWNGPIRRNTIEMLAQGNLPKRGPYIVEKSKKIIKGNLKPLNEKNVLDTYIPCAPAQGEKGCLAKANWSKEIRDKHNLECLGYLHYYKGRCVGGAEFVPSVIVPYKIPRGSDIAFLTCAFLSDKEGDYKSFPLEYLEKKLPEIGYNELEAIVSEKVVFPNGPLDWFAERGYQDLGEVNYEKAEHARMHLVKKSLQR